MPGFFISNVEKINNVTLKNYNDEKCIKGEIFYNELTIKRNVLNSFINDKIFLENEELIIVTDGIIFNSNELMRLYNVGRIEDAVVKMAQEDEKFFDRLDGTNSGAVYYKNKKKWIVYTSDLGDRAVFYYYKDGKYIIGSQLNYLVDCMKFLGIERNFDVHGISCLLDYGYFLDDSTCINGVKRLYPGEYICIDKDGILSGEYYVAEFEEHSISTEDAIDKLDLAFKNAISKIANKNAEYGYKNLLDISGGLDSRIICYATKELGLNESILISYSQSGSNEEKIAQSIANDLGFDFYYKTLDNGKCLKEIDDLIFLNSGVSYYYGITGGKDFLEILDNRIVGMELTGLLGDIYEGSFLVADGLKKPTLDIERFRGSKLCDVNEKFTYSTKIDKFKKNDTFWLYTRGMLAGMGTFLIRQNFVEPVTPFGDREFLKVYLSIPWEQRVNERVLFKWFLNKYPSAKRFPYAATGISPVNDKTLLAKIKIRGLLYLKKGISLLQKKPLPHNMNPAKFWINNNKGIREYINEYYNDMMQSNEFPEWVKEKICLLFNDEKDFNNKAVALTLLAYYKLFLV